jgi:hypothetical protein
MNFMPSEILVNLLRFVFYASLLIFWIFLLSKKARTKYFFLKTIGYLLMAAGCFIYFFTQLSWCAIVMAYLSGMVQFGLMDRFFARVKREI